MGITTSRKEMSLLSKYFSITSGLVPSFDGIKKVKPLVLD
jgi:hypothetical protein